MPSARERQTVAYYSRASRSRPFWVNLGMMICALMIVGVVIFIAFTLFSPKPARAESLPVTLGPAQSVELWREVNGRQPEGLGPNTRAGRLIPGTVFTDHILVRNAGPKIDFIQTIPYWSSPSLEFISWSGKNWNFETSPDPERYIARYFGENGVQPGEVGELQVTFRVKDAASLSSLTNPQAVHSLGYLWVLNGPGEGLHDGELLSQIVVPPKDMIYGWGAGNTSFSYESRNALTEAQPRTIFTSLTHNPFRVQSTDGDTPSTLSEYTGTSKLPCQSQIVPDIRLGEVTYIQSDCVSPLEKYPHLREGNFGTPVKSGRFGLFGGADGKGHAWNINDTGYYLDVQIYLYGVNTRLKIPANQALELNANDGFNPGLRVTRTYWHNGREWVFNTSEARPDEGSPFYSLWNVNYLTLNAEGPAIYSELPYRNTLR